MVSTKFSKITESSKNQFVNLNFCFEKNLLLLKAKNYTKQDFKSHKIKACRRQISYFKKALSLKK